MSYRGYLQLTVEKGQEAITTAIHEFLGANRDPTVVPKQQSQHDEVGMGGEEAYDTPSV